jgi:hypothetical protein
MKISSPAVVRLLPLALLAACGAVSSSFPVPTASHQSPAGFSFVLPANGVVEQFQTNPPFVEEGRIRGTAKINDQLVPYALRYSLIQTSASYTPNLVIDVEKGRCAVDRCKALENSSSTRDGTKIIRQVWPDDNGTLLVVVMLQRGARILKFSWTQENDKTKNPIAEAIAESAMLEEKGAAPSTPLPPSSASLTPVQT